MVETIIYFSLGFLVATVLGLVVLPLVHNRAVRLTLRRAEASMPLSIAEIQADKDHLRAEFAVVTRRLEMTIDQLKAQLARQAVELDQKTQAINALKAALSEKTTTLSTPQLSAMESRQTLGPFDLEERVRPSGVTEADGTRAEREKALAKLTFELGERAVLTDSQRVEIAALKTQIEALKTQLQLAQKASMNGQDYRIGDRYQVATGASERSARMGERAQSARVQAPSPDDLSTSNLMENALLRERINVIAAEVARLTMALEGPGSPLASILASGAPPTQPGSPSAIVSDDAVSLHVNLADRIRALQRKASRSQGTG